jgi:hypothetical protein
VLPNLLVIGAMKCGTTSLHRYLALHPEVWMSDPKELRFFVERGNWHRGVGWYEGCFPVDAPIRGEASPWYTAHPIHRGVPERIASLLPDVKLVYLVRDPIERLLSHYAMERRLGWARRPLHEALGDLGASRFVAPSRYWTQLEQYLHHFTPGQMLVVDQHDLLHERAAALRRVFAFLEVDEDFTSPAFTAVHSARPTRRRRRPAAVVARRVTQAVGERRSYRLSRSVPRPLARALTAPMEPLGLDDDLRTRLSEHFAGEVARLREFTGQDFSSWSV